MNIFVFLFTIHIKCIIEIHTIPHSIRVKYYIHTKYANRINRLNQNRIHSIVLKAYLVHKFKFNSYKIEQQKPFSSNDLEAFISNDNNSMYFIDILDDKHRPYEW